MKIFFIGEALKTHFSHSIDQFLQASNPQIREGNLQLKREWRTLNLDAKLDCRKHLSCLICEEPAGDEDLYGEVSEQLKSAITCKQLLAIVGPAKMGKTQFLKKILRDVKDKYDYISYIALNDINCSEERNVLQLLTLPSALSWTEINSTSSTVEIKLFRKVVERLADEKTKMCIVFDDFEKSNFVYDDYSCRKSYFKSMKTGFLIYNILNRWFPDAQKIILLDPLQFYEMKNVLKTLSTVHELGLNHVEQMTVVQRNGIRCTKTDCGLGDHCLGFVTTQHESNNCVICKCCYNSNCHYEIQSLCYVPDNCNRLKNYCSPVHRQPTSPVSIATSVLKCKLVDAFSPLFTQSACTRMDFQRIGEFAWRQYAVKKYHFFSSDLRKAEFSWKEINSFFVCRREIDCIDLGDLVFFFSHVLLQELLAALWLLSCPSCKLIADAETYRSSFADGSFGVILEFMQNCCSESGRYGNICTIEQNNLEDLRRRINS